MIPKVAVINDLSGFGRCSLTAAISVIASMGVQPVPMPTAVLTAQTGYPSYYCDDFTDRMPRFTEEWGKMQVSFDGIYTGFVLGEKQVDSIFGFLDRFYKEKTVLLVDPVLGDDGLPYGIYSHGLRRRIRELTELSDIMTPNLTELCLLTGHDFKTVMQKDTDALFEEIEKAGKELLNKPGKKIVVTGIRYTDPKNGRLMVGNQLISKEESEIIAFSCCPGSYSGTGDLMASTLIGGVLRGDSLSDTVRLAGTFLHKAIFDAVNEKTNKNDGVPYEPYLALLQKKG